MTADTGPTTVGSIVGKLRLDRSQWVAMMAATKSDIRDLEASDPDIHIRDNAAAVTARLAATKAATDALGASSEELGRKTKRTTEETVKANEANKTSVTRIGAIVTAVALLVPLLAPVGAAAIGVGSAFLGMGAAGVLALIGIHREMEAGTTLGRSYSAGVDSLGQSMNTLSRTSAIAMLSSFRRVVAETREALPGLNTQVGQFSGLLGRSGANLFTGAINSLRVLNPLFLTAGIYVEDLTKGFQRWTEGSGIEKFGGYALSAFPQVVDVLGKLAAMVLHLLQAMAPLGAVGLTVLAGIASGINAIPVEILGQLIASITWGAVAFKAWGFIAPMLATIATSMGAVGAATTIATGPIGWVVAGLSALAGIFAVVIASNTGATRAMQDYTAAVQADSGAIGENVRAKAAQKLLDSGAIDTAKKLGISSQLVLDATLGNAAAQRELNRVLGDGHHVSTDVQAQLDRTGLSLLDYGTAVDDVKKAVETNSGAISGEVARLAELEDMLTVTTAATERQRAADEATAAALGISVGALQSAQVGQDGMQSATEKATAEMYLQGDAAGLLKQAMDALNGKTLTAAEAQNQFEAQLMRLPDGIDAATGKFDAAAVSIDGMSEAAITNRGSLLDLIQSSDAAARAARDNGASSEEARQKMIDGRQAIIDQAAANGMNRDAVTAYIDSLYKIPDSVPKTKIEIDTANAEARIAAFITEMSQKRAVIMVDGQVGKVVRAGQVGMFAGGGTAQGLAGGGGTVFGRGTAGDDNAGLYRLSRGEEVISNRFGQADRSRALLKQINAGYTPSQAPGWRSSTGSDAAGTPTSQREAPIVNVYVTTTQNENADVLGRMIGSGVKSSLAGVTY